MFKNLAIAGFFAASLAASPVAAQSNGDYLPPLGLGIFTEGPWSSTVQDGWYIMENHQDSSSLYRWVRELLPENGAASLSANVFVRPDGGGETAAAGILFDYDSETQNYAALMMDGDNIPFLLLRNSDGFREIYFSNSQIAGRGDGTDVLEARIAEGYADLHLNGEYLFTYDRYENMGASLGILAHGNGRFGFWGFTLQ